MIITSFGKVPVKENADEGRGKEIIVDKSPERLKDQVQPGSSFGTKALKIEEELATHKVKHEALEERLNTLAENQ
jgi:tRNA/tmRNA/rRNA uracil-C5-methylase (TrmA/RlmC/RlmD family)